MFCTDPKTPKARKVHRCTWCGQAILVNDVYHSWKSVDDGWFSNKMHPECHAALHEEMRDEGENTYLPFDNERPENEIQRNP